MNISIIDLGLYLSNHGWQYDWAKSLYEKSNNTIYIKNYGPKSAFKSHIRVVYRNNLIDIMAFMQDVEIDETSNLLILNNEVAIKI